MNTRTFIDTIETQPDIIPLGSAYNAKYGYHTQKYQGMDGNLVIIDTTDEEIDDEQCKQHLMQLGLRNLLISMFPPSMEKETVTKNIENS